VKLVLGGSGGRGDTQESCSTTGSNNLLCRCGLWSGDCSDDSVMQGIQSDRGQGGSGWAYGPSVGVDRMDTYHGITVKMVV